MTRPGMPLLAYPPRAGGMPLPVGPKETWDPELECTPAAWRGQTLGTVLTGYQTPTVAPDGSYFNGRPVAQGNATTGGHWKGALAATTIPAGSPIWSYCVARVRALGGSQVLYSAWAQNFCDALIIYSGLWQSYSFNNLVAGGVADTDPHRFILCCDGVKSQLDVDHAHYEALFTTVGTVAVNDVYMNTLGPHGYHCPVSIAFRMISAVVPTAAEIAAMDAYSYERWGVPL